MVWLFSGVRFTPVLRQWQAKDLGRSAKSAGSWLQLNTHTPLTQRSRSGLTKLSRHSMGTYQGNELTCNSSGSARPKSSQLDEPMWTDPGLEGGITARELISTIYK